MNAWPWWWKKDSRKERRSTSQSAQWFASSCDFLATGLRAWYLIAPMWISREWFTYPGCQGTSSKIFTVELLRELTNLIVELAYYLGGTWAQEGYPFGASQGDGFEMEFDKEIGHLRNRFFSLAKTMAWTKTARLSMWLQSHKSVTAKS